MICSFECTFCQGCADTKLHGRCPNCGGELLRRPRRPAAKLLQYPASTARVHKPQGCGNVGGPAGLMDPDDPHDLARFVAAQSAHYADALGELRAGRKRTHWSWYVLPQLAGLGSSPMSVRYAISGLAEARAYLAHPLLGARLRECVAAMNGHEGVSAAAILGEVDARKFHSCVTLFSQVAEPGSPFHAALDRRFAGVPDAATLSLLGTT